MSELSITTSPSRDVAIACIRAAEAAQMNLVSLKTGLKDSSYPIKVFRQIKILLEKAESLLNPVFMDKLILAKQANGDLSTIEIGCFNFLSWHEVAFRTLDIISRIPEVMKIEFNPSDTQENPDYWKSVLNEMWEMIGPSWPYSKCECGILQEWAILHNHQSLKIDEIPPKKTLESGNTNDARNKWLYDQCCKLTRYRIIESKLAKKLKWEPLNGPNSIKKAANSYATRHGLPLIPKRQNGRPFNK